MKYLLITCLLAFIWAIGGSWWTLGMIAAVICAVWLSLPERNETLLLTDENEPYAKGFDRVRPVQNRLVFSGRLIVAICLVLLITVFLILP